VVSKLVFGFRGTPLLLRVWLDLDRSSLSWVCDKPGLSGSFCSGYSSVERGMVSFSRIEIEKFNGKKFDLCKLKMEDLLVDREQWIVVDPSTEPTGTQSTGTQMTGTQPTSTQSTRYTTYWYVEGRLGEVGHKRKEYYSTLSGRFGVVECLGRIYSQGTMG
jgi:hypothetical protein